MVMHLSVIYPNWAFVILSFVLGLIVLFTAGGNILVFAALFRFKRLRSTSNLLIGNLAISDFLLAITVLPFSATTDATGLWLYGPVLCDIWIVIDVLYCTASVWSLVVIAFDRFTATTFPVWYRGKQTLVRVLCYVILVWILSGLICMPGLLGWGYKRVNDTTYVSGSGNYSNKSWAQSTSTHVYNPVYQGYECVLFTEAEYIVYSALGSFIIPLFIMIGLYAKIFVVLRARSQIHKTGPHPVRSSRQKSQDDESLDLTDEIKSSGTKTAPTLGQDSDHQQHQQTPGWVPILTLCWTYVKGTKHKVDDPSTRASKAHANQTHLSDLSTSSLSHLNHDIELNPSNGTPESTKLIGTPTEVLLVQPMPARTGSPNRDSSHPAQLDAGSTTYSNSDKRPKRSSASGGGGAAAACRKQSKAAERVEQRERRATKRMALIILIFVICWIPFTLMYLIRGLCGESQCPDIPELRKFVTWLGYANSTINPVLYAMFNKEFRQAFAFLLGCRKRKTKR